MSLIDAVSHVKDLLLDQQKKMEEEHQLMEKKRADKEKAEKGQKLTVDAAGGSDDPDNPLYIPPFGSPKHSKQGNKNEAGSEIAFNKGGGKSDASSSGKSEDESDGGVSSSSHNMPQLNPLHLPDKVNSIDAGRATDESHAVATLPVIEEPSTPVVKLGKSRAMPRRGSFRFEQGKGSPSGLDINALLGNEDDDTS